MTNPATGKHHVDIFQISFLLKRFYPARALLSLENWTSVAPHLEMLRQFLQLE